MFLPSNWTKTEYRQFIIEFRRALGIGVPSGNDVDVQSESGIVFRYRKEEGLYLTEICDISGQWHDIPQNNYAQLGVVGTQVNGSSIKSTFMTRYGNNHCPQNQDLARIILATSEAARSQIVYQIVQQMLTSNLTANWDDLLTMNRSWGKFTHDQTKNNSDQKKYHHKSRPIEYGPLGIRDYYDDSAVKTAVEHLRRAGFHFDE